MKKDILRTLLLNRYPSMEIEIDEYLAKLPDEIQSAAVVLNYFRFRHSEMRKAESRHQNPIRTRSR